MTMHVATLTRPTWRTWLALGRVSNLPTVWTNAIAGAYLSGADPSPVTAVGLAVGLSLFYTGGMFLNDAFDREIDARERPERPIPSGSIDLRTVLATGFGQLVAGTLIVLAVGPSLSTFLSAVFLAAAIVLYDLWHKGNPLSPAIMGACRSLSYVTAASAVLATQDPSRESWLFRGAFVLFAYVVALTFAAKRAGGRTVARLIAGISLLDAAFVVLAGAWPVALVVALGFPATLLAQRWIRGT